MVKWLEIGAAAVSLASANAASAQLKGLTPGEIAGGRHARAPDFRMSQAAPLASTHRVAGGMLVSRELAPNAMLGLGLGKGVVRKQGNMDFRISGTSGRGRKPALTFLLHF